MFGRKKKYSNIHSKAELNLRSKKIGDEGAKALAEELKDNSTLKELVLNGNSIGSVGAAAIARALWFNTSLVVLTLDGNRLGDSGAAAMAETLKRNESLTTLVLTSNAITDVGATSLLNALRQNSALTILGLHDNKIGKIGAAAIASALQTNRTLDTLALGDNRVGDVGAAAIAESLKVNSSLGTLYFGNNGIGAPGLRALAGALKVNSTLTGLHLDMNNAGNEGVSAIAAVLANNSTLTTLNLRGNSVGNEGAMSMLHALQTSNTTLTSLDLTSNAGISPDVLSSIREALQANAAGLRTFFLPVNKKDDANNTRLASAPHNVPLNDHSDSWSITETIPKSTLTTICADGQIELDLSGQNLGNDGIKKLVEELKGNMSLKELNLGSNSIGKDGATAIAMVLQENGALKKLVLDSNTVGLSGVTAIFDSLKNNSTLEGISLRGNRLDSTAAAVIARALKSNTTLQELGLGDNNIGAAGAAAITDAVKPRSSLSALGLAGNSIGDAGAAAIASALKENTALTAVDLSGNNIGSTGAAAIAQTLTENKTLRVLDLQANRIEDAGAGALANSLKNFNSTITSLHLGENNISLKMLNSIDEILVANAGGRRLIPQSGMMAHHASPLATLPDSPLPSKADAVASCSVDKDAVKEPGGTKEKDQCFDEEFAGLPAQRAELEFEACRLLAICESCTDTADESKWKEGVEAEKKLQLVRKAIMSGLYPTSNELDDEAAKLVGAIQHTRENESLAAAMPLRARLARIQSSLAREREAEERLLKSKEENIGSEPVEEGRRSVLRALQAIEPTEEVGPVPMEYLASITNDWTEKVGSGGFGVVFRGHDAKSGVAVAVKTIANDRLEADEKANFKKEIEVRSAVH
jgi:Ran GTPase-activating protein (RanGAP) involved in mRNA processing and transport